MEKATNTTTDVEIEGSLEKLVQAYRSLKLQNEELIGQVQTLKQEKSVLADKYIVALEKLNEQRKPITTQIVQQPAAQALSYPALIRNPSTTVVITPTVVYCKPTPVPPQLPAGTH